MNIFDKNTVDFIRSKSKEGEVNGELTKEVLNLIYENKLFKLFLPEELNGKLTELPEALKIFEECSFIDGSFGWQVAIGAGGGYFAAFYERDIVLKLFSSYNFLIAGSGKVNGKARKVSGGYIVNGSWKYCSGCYSPTLYTANCILSNGVGQPTNAIKSFTFFPEQVEIIKDWGAFGLKATASHSIKLHDAFVPEELVFELTERKSYHNYNIYLFPFEQFAQTSFAAVILGIFHHFITEAQQIVEQNIEHQKFYPSRYKFLCQFIEKVLNKFNKIKENFYFTVEITWKSFLRSDMPTEKLLQEVTFVAQDTSTKVAKMISSIFPYLGMHAIMEDTLINRIWRDFWTANQHIILRQ